ncbi:MAG: hypothetical protein ACI865_002908 [Flavobacteriaceae bacterium]|jgi:hypothetical protein
MNSMRKLLLVGMLTGFSFAASSQASTSTGTYQLMTTIIKAHEVFSTEVLFEIEASRAMDELVVIQVGEHTWARILSTARSMALVSHRFQKELLKLIQMILSLQYQP